MVMGRPALWPGAAVIPVAGRGASGRPGAGTWGHTRPSVISATRRSRPGRRRPHRPVGPRRFVVQRHRARRVHYDLRFEIDGVLVSWAVPNGPTLDPAVKRLAVHVEDHPIEYLDFEGVIPRGQYGGGDVIVWDTGTWEPHGTDDPAAAVAAGDFHADVTGHKLRGRLVLVRRGGNGAGSGQWLLLHKADDDAVSGWDPEDYPASVLSGRTNEQVQADPDRIWRSDLPPAQASVALHPPVVAGPTGEELAALDDLGAGGRWEVFGRELRLTNLDKELFPGRDGEPPVTKRELICYTARIAPVVAAVPGGPPAEHAPLPRRRGRARLLAQAAARPRAGLGTALAQPGGQGRREHDLPGGRRAGGAGVGGQLRRAGVARLDRARQRPGQPELRPDRHRPWSGHLLGRRARPGPAAPHGAGAPGRARGGEGHRAARHPDLDTGRRRAELPRHPHLGRAAVQGRSARSCPTW